MGFDAMPAALLVVVAALPVAAGFLAVRIMSSRPAGLLVAGFLPSPAMPYARRALRWYPTTVPSYHLELISALLVTLKSQTSSLGRMGWVAAAKSQKKNVNEGGTRFLTPLFTVWRKRERRAASVPDAIPQ